MGTVNGRVVCSRGLFALVVSCLDGEISRVGHCRFIVVVCGEEDLVVIVCYAEDSHLVLYVIAIVYGTMCHGIGRTG